MSGTWWVRIRDRLRGLVWQARSAVRTGDLERELDEEHRFHLDMEIERLVGEGLPVWEARRRALIAFGGVERWQDEVRETRWTWRLEEVGRDTRYALRWLIRRPLFAAVVIATIGVAVGAATSLFSVVDAVLLHPLGGVPHPDRLVEVVPETASGRQLTVMSLPDYVDYRRDAASAIRLAAQHLSDVTVSADGPAQAVLGFDVSGNYFAVLGVVPALGRFFTGDAVDGPAAPAEVVLSHALWRGRFGEDPGVVGRTLDVNGQPLTIVGVAPAGFHGVLLGARPAVWLPMGRRPDPGGRTGHQWLQVFGRLTAGSGSGQAETVLDAVASRLAATWAYPDELVAERVRVQPFNALPAGQRAAVSRFTLLLLGASGVLLMIAAVNIAGMLLARTARRGREVSVRLALGAGRWRVARQLLVEGALLGLLGGVVGVGLAAVGTRFIRGIQPPQAPGFRIDVGLNGGVLAFALAAAVASSLIFGLMPAWYVTRRDITAAMRTGAGGRSSSRGRSTLLAGQVAMTLILLVVTGMLVRTIRNAVSTDHGFDPEGIVVAELSLRLNRYEEARGRVFYQELLDRLNAAPDVASAALSTTIPLGPGYDRTRVSVPGLESPDPSGWPVGVAAVSERYFETLGLPFLAGGPPDPAIVPPRIVVNRTLAEAFWGEAAPVGRPLRFSGRDAEIAGVVPNGKYRSLSEEPRMFAWVPLTLAYSPSVYVLVRSRVGTDAGVAALRRVVQGLDPRVPLIAVGTLESAMGQGLFLQRVAAGLVGTFAGVALVLSATGIFGLLAFVVEQRRHEICVRMAMGASGAGVVRSVVTAGLVPVLAGIVLGCGGAFAVARVLEGLLYKVGTRDPTSFVSAVLVLFVAAALASWLPARRATGLHPAEALRVE